MLILVVIILQVNGVNISSIVAGVGIVSVTIVLALQDALKDIIMELNILMDNYFHVGDTLKVGDGAINLIIEKAKEQVPTIQSIEYKGLNEFGNSAIYYKIRMYTKRLLWRRERLKIHSFKAYP